ncbi:MAG TPA: hypothetical protein VGR62_04395 [Candidatus Binatia bacterium]|jgi:hypothetical protein|nr:hypothetical protein [Candidatus Binatia bacterium]
MIRTRTHHTAIALLACSIALGGTVPAHASSRQALSPTGVDADASGDAKVNVKSRAAGLRGKLEVRGRKLDAGAAYQVTVDGVRIGGFTTSRSGAGKVRFDTSPNKNDQLLGVDPRGRAIGVVDASGAVVLSTTLTEGGQIGGADTRCCLPDGGGDGPTECEDRTPAECVAQGGVDLGPGSCLPNPCDATTPPPAGGGDIRCCLPDGGGDGPTECEDRTPAQCAAQGGVNIGAGACGAGVCDPTTPPPGGGGGGNAVARVRCERRSNRSKISVDANDIASGTYTARVTSGANTATSGAQSTIGDEVEFDFDSDGGDIGEGATAIPGGFIQGLQVTGAVLDGSGAVVASATVTCEAK